MKPPRYFIEISVSSVMVLVRKVINLGWYSNPKKTVKSYLDLASEFFERLMYLFFPQDDENLHPQFVSFWL